MITIVPNTMNTPSRVYFDKETHKEWLYFDYDGTYQDYVKMPHVIQKGDTFYVKRGHNSDSLCVSYRETDKREIIFKVS